MKMNEHNWSQRELKDMADKLDRIDKIDQRVRDLYQTAEPTLEGWGKAVLREVPHYAFNTLRAATIGDVLRRGVITYLLEERAGVVASLVGLPVVIPDLPKEPPPTQDKAA